MLTIVKARAQLTCAKYQPIKRGANMWRVLDNGKEVFTGTLDACNRFIEG
jgi:hypothetical protein